MIRAWAESKYLDIAGNNEAWLRIYYLNMYMRKHIHSPDMKLAYAVKQCKDRQHRWQN